MQSSEFQHLSKLHGSGGFITPIPGSAADDSVVDSVEAPT